MKAVFAILALMFVLVACPAPPMIETFSATPTALPFGGGKVKLMWTTTNANQVLLDGTDANATTQNQLEVMVSATKTFTLEARGAGGATQRSLEVVVETTPPPTIPSFTATPDTLPFGGGQVTLAWTNTNATSLSLEGANVTGQTSTTVNVTTSRTFTLTATGISGTVQKTVGVFVQDAPPVIANFTATPDTLERGLVTLAWDVLGATSLSISPNVGTVTGNSVQVSVSKNTTFALTASNNGGSDSKNVSVASTALQSNPLGLVNLAWDTNKRDSETDSSNRLSFAPLTYSDIDHVAGGVRYLTATYRVTNLSNAPLENITLRAVAKTGNLGETAAFEVRAFPDATNPDGELFTDPTVAQRIVPLHGMQLGATVPVPDSTASDFQAYRASESASLETSAQGTSLLAATERVLDYGFVTKNGSSRSLPVGGTGLVSVSFRIPRRFDPMPKVFKFKISFLVTTDSAVRVSRALLETTGAAETRGASLGSASNPSQLVLVGSDTDTSSDTAVRVVRLPSIKIGVGTVFP
jgi:hypothetical protein